MKKVLVLIGVVMCCSMGFAQDNQMPDSKDSTWYVGVNVGAQIFNGKNDNIDDFGNRIAPVGTITVGKSFNPWLVGDANISFAQFKGTYKVDAREPHYATDDTFTIPESNYTYGKQRGVYSNIYVRAGFDLVTIFGGYRPDRTTRLLPYVGFGAAIGLGNGNWGAAPTINMGLEFRQAISKKIWLTADFHSYFVGKGLENERCTDHAMHEVYGLKVGVLYFLNK